MPNSSTAFLDRSEASNILKVSTRTLDRYLRKYRIKTRKEGRTILIKRADVDFIIDKHVGHFLEDFKRMQAENAGQLGQDIRQAVAGVQNADAPVEAPAASSLSVKNIKVEEVRAASHEKQENERREKEDTVYKTLYQETKNELKEKQDRLEAATYRVGQLESQLKNMVPLLDFNRKDKELKEAKQAMEFKIAEHETLVVKMEQKLRSERVAKWVYLSLVGLLLIAEPVMFMIWAFS